MNCEACNQRKPSFRHGLVLNGTFQTMELCATCIELVERSPALFGRRLVYATEAYLFVAKAIDAAIELEAHAISQGSKAVAVGTFILISFRRLAVAEFGPRARRILGEWNLFRTQDIGEVVFDMADAGWLELNEGVTKADFANGYVFSEAFPEA